MPWHTRHYPVGPLLFILLPGPIGKGRSLRWLIFFTIYAHQLFTNFEIRFYYVRRLRFFAWVSDRWNTNYTLKRMIWKVTQDTYCVLCPARVYEDRLHLFFAATSLAECGMLFKLTGVMEMTCNQVLPGPAYILEHLLSHS
jgi:hypothetical protein